MIMSKTNALQVALVPGNAEFLSHQLGGNALLSGMASNVARVRNCMYVGVAVTTGFAIGAALTDGGYSLASGVLATASAGITAFVAKNLYKTTSMFQGIFNMSMADNVVRAAAM